MSKLANILANMFKLPSEIQADLAEKARLLRKSKKLSQANLAQRAGVSLGSVKRFEQTGQISLESLLKLAQVLDNLPAFEKLFEIPAAQPKNMDELIRQLQ